MNGRGDPALVAGGTQPVAGSRGPRPIYVFVNADYRHERSHELVRSGAAQEARVETEDGYVLFRAWDHGSETQYAWQTSAMAAPAFWPRETR